MENILKLPVLLGAFAYYKHITLRAERWRIVYNIRMAYLRKIKNREGRIYLSLVESYRDKNIVRQRTLKNYGRLDVLEKKDPNALHNIKQQAKKEIQDLKNRILKKEFFLGSKRDALSCPKNFGHNVLGSIYNMLGIEKEINEWSKAHRNKFDLNKVLRLLSFQRVLNPASKFATVENQNLLMGDWGIKHNDMDRGLSYLYELKEKVQLRIHKSICKNIGRSAILVFYDVTNYYFETDIDDEIIIIEKGEEKNIGMRRRGPSKEKRPNPIVQMGLFIDDKGIPIAYRLFRGNQTDPITYIPAMEQVKKQFKLEKIVTVADKAMNSARNITDAKSKGDGWIFSQKVRGEQGAPKDIQEFALDKEGWEYNANNSFAKKSMLRERVLFKGTKMRAQSTVSEKVVVTWNDSTQRA